MQTERVQTQRTTEDWEQRLGAAVRATRMRRNLTQAELAEHANVSLSSVRSLEQGKGSTVTSLVRVARALGRDEWLDAFSPPEPAISPMAVLRQRQLEATRQRRRVRHPPSAVEPSENP